MTFAGPRLPLEVQEEGGELVRGEGRACVCVGATGRPRRHLSHHLAATVYTLPPPPATPSRTPEITKGFDQ